MEYELIQFETETLSCKKEECNDCELWIPSKSTKWITGLPQHLACPLCHHLQLQQFLSQVVLLTQCQWWVWPHHAGLAICCHHFLLYLLQKNVIICWMNADVQTEFTMHSCPSLPPTSVNIHAVSHSIQLRPVQSFKNVFCARSTNKHRNLVYYSSVVPSCSVVCYSITIIQQTSALLSYTFYNL